MINQVFNEEIKSYVRIYVDGKQKRLHRYLMEQKLGRPLMNNEVVHHIDGNKFNNSIDNLELISRSKHMSIHKEIKELSLEAQTKYTLDYSEIYEMYVNQAKTAIEISKILAIPKATITWFIDKHKIKHKEVLCKVCGRKARYTKAKLCNSCYHKQYHNNLKEGIVC